MNELFQNDKLCQSNLHCSLDMCNLSIVHASFLKIFKHKLKLIMKVLEPLMRNHIFDLSIFLNFIFAMFTQDLLHKMENLTEPLQRFRNKKSQSFSHLLRLLVRHKWNSTPIRILLPNCTYYRCADFVRILALQSHFNGCVKPYETINELLYFPNFELLLFILSMLHLGSKQHSSRNSHLIKEVLKDKQITKLHSTSETQLNPKLKTLALWAYVNYCLKQILSHKSISCLDIKCSSSRPDTCNLTDLLESKEECIVINCEYKDYQKSCVRDSKCINLEYLKTVGSCIDTKLTLPLKNINDENFSFKAISLKNSISGEAHPREKASFIPTTLHNISKTCTEIEGIGVVKTIEPNYCIAFYEDFVFVHKSCIKDLPYKAFNLTEVLSVGQSIEIHAVLISHVVALCKWEALSACINFPSKSLVPSAFSPLLPLPASGNKLSEIKGHGVVHIVRENYLFLKYKNCTENFVFVHINSICDLPQDVNSLYRIVYMQQDIMFHAIMNTKPQARCKWKATSAWLRSWNIPHYSCERKPSPKSKITLGTSGNYRELNISNKNYSIASNGLLMGRVSNCCYLETNNSSQYHQKDYLNEYKTQFYKNGPGCYPNFKIGTGIFHQVLNSEGIIIDNISSDEMICVIIDVTYKNGKKILDFQEIGSDEIVHYRAFLDDKFCSYGYQWKAIAAWVGCVPDVVPDIDFCIVHSKEFIDNIKKLYVKRYEEIYTELAPEIEVSQRPTVILKSSIKNLQ